MTPSNTLVKPSGRNLGDIQQSNRSLILRLIRQHGSISRVELARQSGLKQATITYIINSFIEKGIVHETGLMPGTEGRRVKGVCLNTEDFRLFAVRIVSTYYLAGIFDLAGNCLKVEKRFFDPSTPAEAVIEKLSDEMEAYCEEIKGKSLLGIGIAIPSFHGKTQDGSMLTGAFPEDMEQRFEERFGVPVMIENDAKLAAYARWNANMGMDKGIKGTLVCILVSETLSCGIVINGKMHMGVGGMAGEIGHMGIDMNGIPCECGNRGCLEKYASVPAVMRMLDERIKIYPETRLTQGCNIREVIAAYNEKDPLAVSIYEDVANCLGYAVANLINLMAPDRITIGDEVPRTDPFLERIKDAVRRRVAPDVYQRTIIEYTTKERRRDRDVPMVGASMMVSVMALDSMIQNDERA